MRNWWKISVGFLFIQKLVVCAVHVDVLASSFGRTSMPLPLDAKPDFRGPMENVTAPVGREAILSCSVTDLGHYRVAWARAEDQTILSVHTRVITHNPRISVTHDDNLRTWRLHIRQLKETDRGCYMCQINTNTMKKQLGCVDVQVPPDINDTETSGDVTVTEGDNATLVCKASGRPEPRILWRREDGEHLVLHPRLHETETVDTFNGPVLSLVRLERRQMGAYLCIASNDVPPAVSKRIILNVNFAPVIKVPNQLLGAPLNTDVQLECYVEAFPNTINYWVKNRGEILMSGKKQSILEERYGYKVHMTLTIHNLLKRDIGTYTCVATNSMGKTDGTIRLYEIKVPQTQLPTSAMETRTTETETATSTQFESVLSRTTTIAFRALQDNPMDNFLPSAKPAPLETMLANNSALTAAWNSFFITLFALGALLR